MEIRIETSSYNEKRYGKPWIARVDFAASTSGEMVFGKLLQQVAQINARIAEIEKLLGA